ncbi:hypothetical protein [Lacunisphaera limnophila]|uniref:hypothetical protein n=1 Tax=Lacunisphaera limnophila TaxID=1838286 RepID=UPI000859A4F3|nr:hypothetical protein [Lacunisphaera limnophila]
MNHLAQTFLIGGGILGLIPSTPIAAYGWFMHRGFGGDLTNQDRMLLYAPFVCAAEVIIGICWRKLDARKEQIQLPETTRGK